MVASLYACDEGDADVSPSPGSFPVVNNPDPLKNVVDGWRVPLEYVLDRGSGKDGIPALENVEFIPVDQVDYLPDDDLVIGIKIGNDVKAFPYRIVDWREIANVEVNSIPMALSLCPLTGTTIVWERTINRSVTTFGVSGLLYNSNLVPYDRRTDSNWSQMSMDLDQEKDLH